MQFEEIFSEEKIQKIPDKKVVGIDIGSRQSKAVLLANGQIYVALIPTGYSMKENAETLLNNLLKQSGLARENIEYIVATGYGRIALEFEATPHRVVTEISCHGLGAHYLGSNIHTIIDIGGQDSKVIRIDPDNGKVIDFVMNDKCAAGTGRFLEKSANILGIEVAQLGELSLKASDVESISSQCVVFAESEIISSRAKGVPKEDIAAGIHLSVAKRVSNLLNRVGIEPEVLFTGGVSNNIGMKAALEKVLGFSIQSSKLNTVYAGALGAAIYAADYAIKKAEKQQAVEKHFELDLINLENAIEKFKGDYINKATGKKKNVAYLCSYTPIEILSAANVTPIRLYHKGDKREIASGEMLTKSVFCDFTKSIIGGFIENNPLHKSIDKIYMFYTCDCMRKTAEALNTEFVPTTVFNLPRVAHDEDSRRLFTNELRAFRKDLEQLTGEEIPDEKIREQIRLYNKAKQKLRAISQYRRGKSPVLSSTQYQKIAQAYFYLPVEDLLVELDAILDQLKHANVDENSDVIRLMLTGGVLAEGDTKVTKIIEEEIGASIVIEDSCSGYSPFARDISEDGEDVFEDLSKGYFGKAPCVRMIPMDDRVNYATELAKEYNVDGVIYYYLKFCPGYSIGKDKFVKAFQKENIPIMELATDYSTGDEGQIKTRIEAFKEVLEEKR